MSEHTLKPGRQTYRFDQMAVNVNERVEPGDTDLAHYVGLEHLDTDSLKIRRWGTPEDVEATKLRFRKGDIIFGRRRVYQRKLAVAEFDGICSAHAMVLRANPAVVLPEFLPFFMQSDLFMNRALEISVGSLSPTINWHTLAAQEFPLPPPEEQRRLVEVLRAAEEVKVQTRLAHEAAWSTRIATYSHLTVGEDRRTHYKESPFEDIPSHWNVEKVGDVVLIENSLRKPISAEDRHQLAGPYPYWGATGILDSINEFRLNGTYALIGEDGDHFLKYTIWSMTHLVTGCFNVNNHVHVIRGTDLCSTEWFFHYFRHRDVREWLTKQGAGRLKLKKADLVQIPIALPPLQEQLRISELLDWVVSGEQRLARRVVEAERFLKSILSASFKH